MNALQYFSIVGNHKGLGKGLGYQIVEYNYWNESERRLDLPKFLGDLRVSTGSSLDSGSTSGKVERKTYAAD